MPPKAMASIRPIWPRMWKNVGPGLIQVEEDILTGSHGSRVHFLFDRADFVQNIAVNDADTGVRVGEGLQVFQCEYGTRRYGPTQPLA